MNKKAKLVLADREKLLIALQLPELVGAINTAMRTRKASFTLDYQELFPRLFVQRPGTKPELLMTLNPQKKVSFLRTPTNPEHLAIMRDIITRLENQGAKLMLTGDRVPNGPRVAKLQLYCDGATRIALTLMTVSRGHVHEDTGFKMPDGSMP